MYVPSYAESSDVPFLHDFIEAHDFGSLISRTAEGPYVNHFPFLLSRERGELLTHMARGNPQWRQLRKDGRCLVTFQGPQAYISPRFYVKKMHVPTWSYTAVHADCVAEAVEDPAGIEEILARTVARYETGPNAWKYDLPEDFRAGLVSAIVGVKLKIFKLEGKFKLSQNRDAEDYAGVVREFEGRTDDNSRELLRYMRLTQGNRPKTQ